MASTASIPVAIRPSNRDREFEVLNMGSEAVFEQFPPKISQGVLTVFFSHSVFHYSCVRYYTSSYL